MIDDGTAVLIDSATVGRGDEELGRILMNSFLHSMAKTSSPAIILPKGELNTLVMF